MSNLIQQLEVMRKTANLTQDELATHAGLNRMTVQRAEAGQIDPRLSSVQAIAKTLNVELMLVPTALRHELESFVRSGGRFLGQPPGAGAPLSIVQTLKR
ncbi:MAG: helix-turn-helix transcriptional regulator [Polaromonas sp.]